MPSHEPESVSVRGLTVIAYNHLNLPSRVSRSDNSDLVYVYDATGRKLSQVLIENGPIKKRTDYNDEFIYENDTLQFINTAEGRVVPDTTQGFVYQYNLKDHLGNVRTTFTTKHEQDVYTATFEDNTQAQEQADFLNYGNVSDWDLMDHTDASNVYTKSQLLNGGYNSQVGLAKTLAVVPGDTITVEAYAHYNNETSTNGNLTGFAAALAGAFGLSSGGSGEAGEAFDALDSYGSIIASGSPHDVDDEYAPKAYLNIMLFDKDYNFVDGKFQQISTSAEQQSSTVKEAHEYLSRQLVVSQAGYVYIFLSNENPTQVDVYFDDITITHTKSPVIQSDDYYPFGLAFNSYSRENSTPNDYKFAGKEEQNELGLNLVDFGLRMYDPAIARWMVIDPLAHKLYAWSPFNYALNNPVMFVDPDGALPWPVHVRSFISTPTTGGGAFRGDGRGPSTANSPQATSRVRSSFTVDPAKGTVSNLQTKSDPTVFFGAQGPQGGIPPMVKEGKPEASITNVKSSDNTTSLDFSHSGKDPITPGFATPALDVHSSLSITEDMDKGVLSINGSFTGDNFPSTEAFIVDQSGNGKVFLGAQMEQGGLMDLYGDNKEPLFKVNIQVQFDSKGNFTGVQQGDKKYTVEEWNKHVQESFKKN